MAKSTPTTITEFTRSPGTVFVDVSTPKHVQQVNQAQRYYRDWTAAANAIASEPVDTLTAVEKPTADPIPTAEALLAAHLPKHIAASRWGIYVIPSKQCRVFDGTTFIHTDPHPPFWNLYNLAKGIFRDLGIKLSKSSKGVWVANIPVKCLTDKVFVESGLAGVEKTLRTRTNDDASIATKIADSIRHRQLNDTKAGISKVKAMRETLSDAAGVVAITAVAWAAYVVMGVA